jgi:predicted nucleic acid-binding Zn ribbon protein
MCDSCNSDFFAALDYGKRNNKEHFHTIVHTFEPTIFLERRFKPWLKAHGIKPEATDVKVVSNWCNYIIGHEDTKILGDLARMSSYATRTPEGDYVRLLTSQSLARGVFVKARAQLVRETEPGPPPASVGACETCGAPLPSGARRTRRFCGSRCRVRNHRHEKQHRAKIVWRVRLRAARTPLRRRATRDPERPVPAQRGQVDCAEPAVRFTRRGERSCVRPPRG